MEENDFQYSAEYAKSSRASCRHCKSGIEKGSLRLAALVQSPTFDGKIPHWYHYMCFFGKQKPKSVEDIAHFDSLRWDDQEKIRQKLGAAGGGGSSKTSAAKSSKSSTKKDKNFSIEYAKSGRAACKGCEEKILKGEIRISALDFESEKAKRFGPIPQWHHVDCFIGLRNELQYYSGGADLPGFNTLSGDDKKMIREKIRPIKRENEDTTDSKGDQKKSGKEELIKKQNIQMFSYRDNLEENLSKTELSELLEYNDYDPISGESKMLDTLADLMTFGNIGRCKVCKIGNLRFRSGAGYFCNGRISEWAKCTNIEEKPARHEFKIPNEFKETYPFLKKYKYKKNGDREFVVRQVQSENSSQGVKRKEIEKSELNENLVFAIVGIKDKKRIKEKVDSIGGKISSTIDISTAAVFTTKDLVDRESKKLQAAKTFGVECVPEDFFDSSEPSDILMKIKMKNMAPWAKEDVVSRLSKLKKLKTSHSGLKNKNSYESNMSDKMKIVLKDGGQVDSKSGLEDSYHVYKQSEKLYSVVLGLVDISKGMNSYYKLQVLEADDKSDWYLFRSWGRIGTNIGDFRLENKDDLQDALADFNKLYEEKTGNRFKSKNQEKLPGYWYPLDIDHGEKNKDLQKLSVKKSKSKLALAIQELISLIFDVKKMECTMMEYELDLRKMPLGKLSQKQIEDAFKVLSEVMEWIDKLNKKEESEETKASSSYKTEIVTIKNHILDCSNRFYTLIPHDFGVKNPPLLDNEEYIKNKIDMVNSLKEIEIAYNLLKSESKDSKAMDPIDEAYKKLKTDIEVLEKSSDEFDLINRYLKNTHAATHTHYSLELEEVFKVKRQGEEKRFKPFKKLHNRQLLWHGSRLTNFVGILSQGLRIAPPEAPVTGYMFGKGIYFADMVSKSANYCSTSTANPTGLLLLCDVALGDMYELKGAKSITKLPAGKHSTKGLGATGPDPTEIVKLDDGLQVPLGTPKSTDVKNPTLLYNEYIVYDTSQVNIKYLLKTNFKYKY